MIEGSYIFLKEYQMKRRNFLGNLISLPAVGLLSSFGNADNLHSDEGENVLGLNKIVEIIKNDKRLNSHVDTSDILTAIEAAQKMNAMIIKAILHTGVGNDKKISTADIREINTYISTHYQDEWANLHGDEEDEGSGFHLVVHSGAKTRLFGHNAVNRVFHNIYHLGFETDFRNQLTDEYEEKAASFKQVAHWLNDLLKADLEAGRLYNHDIHEIIGSTHTRLDEVIEIIYHDKGLQKHISTGDMRIGATSCNTMNSFLLEAIKQTNAGVLGKYTKKDMQAVNTYLVSHYADAWEEAYGYDDDDESGYHTVQWNGAKSKLFGKNAINKVFAAIYHLGFETPYQNRLVDDEGEESVSFKRVAKWLSKLLADELNNQKDDLKILIPLYSYPNWYNNPYRWQTLIDTKKQYPNVEIIAIVNPNNGQLHTKNSDYTRGIQDLIQAGIKVVGYVFTKYGARNTQEIVKDIEAWKTFYKAEGVSGIFFDETSNKADLLDFYTNLSKEARDRGLPYVILNPGNTTDPSYINTNIADLIVSYENTNEELTTNPPTQYNSPTDSTKLSLLIYKMKDNSIKNLISFAREHHFSYIYFTEDGLDKNPWDSISNYLDAEIKAALK